MLVRLRTRGTCVVLLGLVAACKGAGNSGQQRSGALSNAAPHPDEAPVMVNKDLPFRYPPPLYARKVQGNVTLRLYIDTDGRTRPESTRVVESSGYPPLDSAAIKGAQELHFIPAKLHGEPVGVVVLFPVYFRHPEAAPLPGDTILGKRDAGSGKQPPDQASRSPLPASRP